MTYPEYLGYKEVMNLLRCSKGRAYEIILELRNDSGWVETYECKHQNRINIPKKIFARYYPAYKWVLKK